MSRRIALAALAVVMACAGAGILSPAAASAPRGEAPTAITVAAASDLRPAFELLGRRFTADTGIEVTFTFGSSGQLAEQIINGAPFDLFASADVGYVDSVIDAGRGVAGTKADYAYGRIVTWSPPDVAPARRVQDLARSRFARIAIANPDHAPYGIAAQQALKKTGTYPEVEDRLVYGENIADTFRIVQSGNADAGIVALSLAVADGSPYHLIPARLHEPLRQALVVTSTGAAGRSAERFASYLGSPKGRTVMTRYGFVLPGEKVPGR